MIRNLQIEIVPSTWPAGPPDEIAQLQGTRSTNITDCLVHIALRTRPPEVKGFHLSDCWALLRYWWAFEESEDLRLAKDWDDLDPHQKSILSDDFGVGLTTQLFAEELDWTLFADTRYFLKVLLRDAVIPKVGKGKLPDYVARDASGRLHVLECKGTQSSLKRLDQMLHRGVEQKSAFPILPNERVTHSLVAGAFIPRSGSKHAPTIRIIDPDPAGIEHLLARVPPGDIERSVAQVDLAKNLSLMGFLKTAGYLATTPTADLRTLPANVASDLRRTDAYESVNTMDYDEVGHIAIDGRRSGSPSVRLSVPRRLIERLATADMRELLTEELDRPRGDRWKAAQTQNSRTVTSSFGFRFEIERGR